MYSALSESQRNLGLTPALRATPLHKCRGGIRIAGCSKSRHIESENRRARERHFRLTLFEGVARVWQSKASESSEDYLSFQCP
jgi:hypothetical protein